ncbi:MAG: aminoglycoside phosphotransferase family protein [Nocardioides sp.]
MLTAASGPRIAAAFGLGGDAVLTGPVARGEKGQVWRLETGRGRYAVKDAFEDVDAAAATADAAYQDVVRASGVPMPAVLRSADDRVLVEVDGQPVRVYAWVDVLPRDRRLDAAVVGRVVAQVHGAVVPADEPMSGWYADPVGADRWHDLVGRLERGGAPFAADLASLVPQVLAVEEVLEPVRATQWCHRDLWADNVVATPSGGVVVLDWESSGPGNPSHEVAAVLVEFGDGDVGRMRDLYAAYVDAGGPGRITRAGDLTVLVAQLGHIAVLGCERWLSSTTDTERAHHEAWVREYVDEPVTLEIVDLVLEAVSSRRRP